MALKKAQKKAKKHAEKSAAKAQASVTKAERALEELQKLAATAGPVVSEGAREARARALEFVDNVRPGVEENLRAGRERFSQFSHDLGENLGPRAQKFREDVEGDYLPRAKRTATATGNVLRAAAEAARKEFDKGKGDIRSAVVTPVKPAKKKCGLGKTLLVVTLVGAGAAAGYVAWKKTRPVEDPWAPPADFARAHYPASAGTESDSSTVSDTVGSADAGDVANALKGDDRSSDTTPKAVKVDSADPKDAKEAKPSAKPAVKAESKPEVKDAKPEVKSAAKDGDNGKVIDPVGNPKENPADPKKRGNHRGEA